MRRLPRRVASKIGAPLTYLLMAVLAHLPAFSDLAGRTRCDCLDHPQTDWFLAWTPYAVLSGQSPWTTTYLSVPDGVNLMWNTLMPLPGLLMAPVTLVAGPIATHTLLSVLGFAGGATSMWWVTRRWATWWFARFVAGLLYGFSPYEVAQASGHVNLALIALPPLVLLLGDEVLVRQRSRPWVAGALLGLVALAQLLTTEEVLASMFVMAAIGAALLAWSMRKRLQKTQVRHAAVGLGVAAGVLTAGAAWPLSVQFFGPHRVTGPVQDASTYAADLLGAFVPTIFQVLGSSMSSGWARNGTENGSYLGVPLLIVVAALAWRYRTVAVVRFAAVLGVIAWVLSLGDRLRVAGTAFDVPLPFWLLSQLPVLHNLAAVRFSLYVVLCVALVLAVALDRLHAEGAFVRPIARRRTGAVVLVCALPLLPTLPYSFVDSRTPSYFTSGAVERVPEGAVVFTYPVGRFPDSAPMEWQAQAGFRYRALGGYVITPKQNGDGTFAGDITVWERVVSQAYTGRPLTAATQVQRRLLQEMTELQVRAVLIADRPGAGEVIRLTEELLGRPADERTGGVTAWYLAQGPAAGPLTG